MTETRMRYRNAWLTVDGSGDLTDDAPLGRAVAGYRSGETSADDLAWAYLQARVVAHTPSFSWKTADLDRLLAAVVGNIPKPGIEATNAWDLAGELLDRFETLEAERKASRPAGAADAPVAPAVPSPKSPRRGLVRRAVGGVGTALRASARVGRRLLPGSRRGKVVLVFGVALIAAGTYGVSYYLTEARPSR